MCRAAGGVEYVQFVDHGVPNCFRRVVFEDGRKTASMRARANGGGTYFGGMTAREAIEKARKDEGSIILDHRRGGRAQKLGGTILQHRLLI